MDRDGIPRPSLCLLLAFLVSALASARATSSTLVDVVPQVRVNPHTAVVSIIDRNDIQFSHVPADQGLSQIRVTQIVEDDQGFLWFATEFGLNRYDGYNFKVFAQDAGRNGPGCVSIRSLLKARDGALWVGCEHGVDRFDAATETFRHYPIEGQASGEDSAVVSNISQDHTGVLWLSTDKGLFRLEPETGRSVHYVHAAADPSSLSSNDVKSAGEDRTRRFWVADGDNLEEFDREHGRVVLRVSMRDDSRSAGLGEGYISFYEDRAGSFWIFHTTSGLGSGLATLDRRTNELVRYTFHGSDSPDGLAGGIIAVVEDRYGVLWFATKSDGLLRFDRERQVWVRYRNNRDEPESLAENRTITLFADREGNVWVGLHAMTPDFFPSRPRVFAPLLPRRSNPNSFGETFINAVYEDHQGIIWVATTGALIRLDRTSGQYTAYAPPGPGANNDIVAITEDRAGTLWVGSIGAGLASLDRKTGRFKTYRYRASDPSSLSNDLVSRMLPNPDGTLWVTTWDGLDRFDPATGHAIRYHLYGQEQTERYFNIARDQFGNLWMGGSMGLTRFDPSTGRVLLYAHRSDAPDSLSDNNVTNVHIDRSGTVWVGTENGLNRLNPRNGTFSHFYASDGLPASAVSCILEEQSRLWMSTTKGLSRFDLRTGTFANYSTADGLPGNDLTGWDACYESSSGEMFFGGFSGGVSFFPDQVQDPSYTPPIVLTDLQLSGRSIAIGPDSPLKRAINYEMDLTLSHAQSVFSLSFSALNYFNATGNRYRYKLEGLDRQWTEVGSDRRVATYTTLPAGTYIFQVQGAARRGPWSEPGVRLRIRVLPPWWGTWWFRTMAGLLVGWILWELYRARIRHISRQLTVRLNERLAERTRIAQELHDTLLQGLTSAKLQLEVAQRQISNDSPANALVRRVTQMLRQLADESRHAVRDLRTWHAEEEDLQRALMQVAKDLAASGTLKYRIVVEGAVRRLQPIVRDEVFRIGGEALVNAFRHSGGTTVEALVEYGHDHFRLLVRDDGCGIDAHVLNVGREDHFGLSGMRERAKKIGARLKVRSAAGAGAEIDLMVPAIAAFGQPSRRGAKYWLSKLYVRSANS